MTRIQQGYLSAFSAVLIWSGFILVSRMGGVSELSYFDVIAIRYATCACLLLPVWWFRKRFNLLNPKLIIASLVGGLAYALCTFRGFQLSSASHAALLLPGMMPLFIIVLSRMINREAQTKQKWIGVGVITLGVSALFLTEVSGAKGILPGDFWLLAGSFFWALFSVLIKRWHITPWQVTVSLSVITCALYLPVYLIWLPKNIDPSLWSDVLLQALYQGVLATIVQMMFYVKAVQIIGPSSMGTMMAIVPVLSGISAILLFDEPASVALLVGLVSVSIGAWVANRGGTLVGTKSESSHS